MTFLANTYIVLDIPSPYAERVIEIRERQRDFARWSLPAETTVSGSNGTGPIAMDEDPKRVLAVLDRIATESAPIKTAFGPAKRFPGSDVFYLSFVDETPFRELHARIARSGVRLSPVPFPFEPHCTLRNRAPISEEEAADLLSTRVPGEFTLDTLSLYELPPRTTSLTGFTVLLCLIHRVHLTGRS